MKTFFPKRRATDDEIDRAIANIGAIDLRPRKQVHSDALGSMIDQLHVELIAEKKREQDARDLAEASVSSQIEISALISAYSVARESLL